MTTTKTKAETWSADPVAFYQDVLKARLSQKQVDILEAVQAHPRVAVCGCNGSGKDYIGGRLVAWWLSTHHPAIAIALAPSQRQAAITWSELQVASLDLERSAGHYSLGGRMLAGQEWRVTPNHYALGFSTDRPLSIQGYHSPHLLVLVTEAHSLEEGYWEAIHRLQPTKLVALGNPLCLAGSFYDAFHTKRDLWQTVQIAAEDCPNVQEGREVIPGMINRQWVEDRKADWGEGSPLYAAAVLGQFPDSLEDTLIPLSAVVAASKRAGDASGPVVVACDVARFGADETVILQRQGNVAKVLHAFRGADLMKTTGILKGISDDLKPEQLVVDSVGIGAGVVDRLRELHVRVVPFSGGTSPRGIQGKERFTNHVAQAWWAMREWFLSGDASIPNDAALIAQVSGRKYEILSDKRVRLESKDGMARSPDRADALAMTFGGTGVRPGSVQGEKKTSIWRGY